MFHRQIIAGILSAGLAAGALAAGSSSSSTRSDASSGQYGEAVAAVKAGSYARAARLLEGVVTSKPGDADAWNYLGFSRRKLGDRDAAMVAYRRALAIDPKHRGAHEYLGELYLDLGDLAAAKEQLQRLDRLCTFGCEEYDDLEAAIAKHEAG